MIEIHQPTCIVSDAATSLGHRVVELLLEARRGPVVALTASSDPLADLSARGAFVDTADFDDVASIQRALHGGERVLIIGAPSSEHGALSTAQRHNALTAVRQEGLKQVLLTSLAPSAATSSEHADLPRREGPRLTFLRHNIFTDDLLHEIREAIITGRLLTAGDIGAAYVTREDCACVAACLLSGLRLRPMTLRGSAVLDLAEEGGATINLTGPQVVTPTELARLITETTGHEVECVPIDPEALRMGLEMARHGYPLARIRLMIQHDLAHGQYAGVSTVVDDVIGRPATSVAEFLARNMRLVLPRGERDVA